MSEVYVDDFETWYPDMVFVLFRKDENPPIRVFLTPEKAHEVGGGFEKRIPEIKQHKDYDNLKMFPAAMSMPIEDEDGSTRKDHVWIVHPIDFKDFSTIFWYKENAEKRAQKRAELMNKEHTCTKFPIEEFL